MNFRSEAVLPALSLFFGSFRGDCPFVFKSCKLSKRNYRMDFSAEHCRKSLDFAPAGDDASSGESGTSDRSSSSISHFNEKLDDHNVRFDVKEVLRRKLQGKIKSMLAEVDVLKKWHSELCVTGFSCEMLNLTTKHSQQLPAHFSKRVFVYPSNVYTYAPQIGPFQPVGLIVHVDGKWNLQCPIYEHMVVKSGTLETLEASHLAKVAKEMLCGDQTCAPVS